jgi:hypothetical protein
MDFPILGTLGTDDRLSVIGSDAEQNWWRVCCVDGQYGWIAASVVTLQGDPDDVPESPPLIPDDLTAAWAIRWECEAEGCPSDECFGESTAEALRVRTTRWLEVERQATWEEACGEDEDWLTEVDRYSGEERQDSDNPPLFVVWAGADPGPENRRLELLGRTLSLWCTDSRVREVEQGDGWTVLYEGQACYDRASGTLATMEYTKRWLFTGEFGGRTYDRQYFGDFENYQQILTESNAPLSGD